jgi:two-component system chemotaxis response regulator CheY
MKKKVLVIEDNADHQAIIKSSLVSRNYLVVCADNPSDALHYLLDEKIDLIILDLWLPEMDGLSFLKDLKNVPEFSEIPVIVTSGTFGSEYDILKLNGYGVREFFMKPYDPAELVETVGSLLKKTVD